MDSIAVKRRAEILQELGRGGRISVADLSRRFRISEVSIRRDMRHLEERGLLKRVQGGAIPVSEEGSHATVPGITDLQAEKKERIGRAGAALIGRGECVMFDSGTTPLQVAAHIDEQLLSDGKLTIITASFPIVNLIGSYRGLHFIVLGGVFLPEWDLVVGPQTIDALKGLHADKLFLGTDGLTFSQGVTTANVLEAEVDRAMANAATETIVVADSSKIGRIGLASIMPITGIARLVTDTDAPGDFVARLRDHGIEVILV